MTERLGVVRPQEIVRTHGAVAREQVAAHQGVRGQEPRRWDGFVVAFSSARRAVKGAIVRFEISLQDRIAPLPHCWLTASRP